MYVICRVLVFWGFSAADGAVRVTLTLVLLLGGWEDAAMMELDVVI